MATSTPVIITEEADFTTAFPHAAIGRDGRWAFDAGQSTGSSLTGPGVNNALTFMHTETSGSGTVQTYQERGLVQFATVPAQMGRVLHLRVCIQGEFGDGVEGLRVQHRASGDDPWTQAGFITGWAYSDSHTKGGEITDEAGAKHTCVADGGWIDVKVAIPDTATIVSLQPIYVLTNNLFRHDIALRSFFWEWPDPPSRSTDANLSSLTISDGTNLVAIVPAFDSDTTSYTAEVGDTVTGITVTATLADSTASMTIQGVAVPSATVSGSIGLGPTTNVVIKVAAEDGTTTKTYTIVVTKTASPPPPLPPPEPVRIFDLPELIPIEVPTYELVVTSFTPAENGPPMLSEMASIPFAFIKYKNELNRYATWSAQINGQTLPNEVAQRLINYKTLTTEFRVYRNGRLMCAGPMASIRFNSNGVILVKGFGVGYWLKYDYLIPQVTLDVQGDLTQIARTILTTKQGYPYGNVGITADNMVDVGIDGHFELAQNKGLNAWEAISDLEDEGFTFYITPEREFICPVVGVDQRNDIIFNRVNTSDPSILINMSADKVATVAAITNSERRATETNDTLIKTLGRKVIHQTVDTNFTQDKVDDIAEKYLAANENPIGQLGGNVLSLQGISPVAYGLNDVLGYEFDLSWNVFFGTYAVRSISVAVTKNGTEKIITEEV